MTAQSGAITPKTGGVLMPEIDSRANRLEQRPLDEHLYASRNLVERFFCRIKQFRRVATRYDKLSERFSSFVAISASFIWTC
jgi:transposase